MREELHYFGGPYKGYYGQAEYDEEAGFFHGEVVGLRDVVTFQAPSLKKIGRAFRESVDDYLEFCQARGQAAEKPFSGRFVTRDDPQLHRILVLLAKRSGKSLNQFVGDSLSEVANSYSVTPVKNKSRAKKRASPATR